MPLCRKTPGGACRGLVSNMLQFPTIVKIVSDKSCETLLQYRDNRSTLSEAMASNTELGMTLKACSNNELVGCNIINCILKKTCICKCTLKADTVHSPKMSVLIYERTRHNPEDQTMNYCHHTYEHLATHLYSYKLIFTSH
jgi:hypothetical protein